MLAAPIAPPPTRRSSESPDFGAPWTPETPPADAARDALVEQHLGLVHHLARRVARRLGAAVGVAELVSAGSVGLLQAVDEFDPSRGLAFSTYAVPRIHGAMLDELRRLDPAPRSVRRKARCLADAESAARREARGAATPRDVARHAGVDLPTLWQWQAELARHEPLSLDDPVDDDPEARRIRDVACTTAPAPDELVIGEEQAARLRDAILALPAQERAVLTLTYFEELSRGEVAEVMHLSESRISRLRTSAIQRLREQLAPARRSA
ncbi:MAG TPA: sigma-70 family RNA polymerase sigma factor [Gemmatimonadaceae bacterium]